MRSLYPEVEIVFPQLLNLLIIVLRRYQSGNFDSGESMIPPVEIPIGILLNRSLHYDINIERDMNNNMNQSNRIFIDFVFFMVDGT